MQQLDVLSVGDIILDIFLGIPQDNFFSCLDEKNHQICFRYGQKIHVDTYKELLGGNACNVAVGLSRIGKKTELAVEIGDDDFTHHVLHLLDKEHVAKNYMIQTPDTQASFAVGVNYGKERTLFIHHVKRHHDFHFEDANPSWIYLTSMGDEWEKPYRTIVALAEKSGAKLAFSPGTHQLEAGFVKLQTVVKASYMVFVNKEEAELLTDQKGADIKTLLTTIKSFGPKLVSITDGTDGAYAIDANGMMFHIGIFPNTIIEKTGAGDAYSAGVIGALIDGHALDEAMRWGALNASSVVAHIGAQEGLLPGYSIENTLFAHPEFVAKAL